MLGALFPSGRAPTVAVGRLRLSVGLRVDPHPHPRGQFQPFLCCWGSVRSPSALCSLWFSSVFLSGFSHPAATMEQFSFGDESSVSLEIQLLGFTESPGPELSLQGAAAAPPDGAARPDTAGAALEDSLSVLSLCPGREWDGEVQHGEPGGVGQQLNGWGKRLMETALISSFIFMEKPVTWGC